MYTQKKKICRLCLVQLIEATVSYSLLEDKRSNILESLTSIKVNPDDTLPKYACVKCWLNLNLAYKIQQKILEADNKLSSISEVEDLSNLFEENQQELVYCQKSNEDSQKILEDTDGTENIFIKIEHESDLECSTDETNVETLSIECEEIKAENISHAYLITSDEKLSESSVKIETEKSLTTYHLCQICGLSIEENHYFEHVKVHYNTRIQCEECDVFCESIKQYHKHVLANHHDAPKYWHCEICQCTFQYKPLYNIHMKKAHNKLGKIESKETNLIYDCLYCKKIFKNEQKYLIHMKSHNKKQCPICPLKITPTNFKKHVDAHSSLPVVCHICGITYKNDTSLRSHIHYTHSTRTYMCKFCKKVYKKSYDLLMHEKKEHTGERDHVCDICGKRFFTFYNLNKHTKMTHMKLRPHQCSFCKKRFSSKHSLKTHERQHTNVTPYNCEICGEGFRQKVSLKGHRKSRHNIVEPETCECKVCGKKFSNQFAIISHMRLH